MSKEKYMIEDHDLYLALMCNGKGIHKFSIDQEDFAELVCRLLNEQQDKPKIDKEVKTIFLEWLIKNIPNPSVNHKKYAEGIKAIQNLSTEEN